MIYAVRCCCVPIKVMGWLDLPAVSGPQVTVPLMTRLPSLPWSADDSVSKTCVAQVTLSLRRFMHADGTTEMAVYSDDRPLSFWLNVPGFRPNIDFVE